MLAPAVALPVQITKHLAFGRDFSSSVAKIAATFATLIRKRAFQGRAGGRPRPGAGVPLGLVAVGAGLAFAPPGFLTENEKVR